jgi:NADH-quinone oxidoreductase subunit H
MSPLGDAFFAESWRSLLALPDAVPAPVVAALAVAIVLFVVVLPSGAVLSIASRKMGADLQARIGPRLAGPAGVLQPVSDLLKLLQKKGAPSHLGGGSRIRTWSATFFYIMTVYSTVAALPLGSTVLLIDAEMSAFLPFLASLVLALGTMLLGISHGTVPSWFGGLRVAQQAVAGAVPALFALLTAGMRSGGFRWTLLADSQAASPWSWGLFVSPFDFLAFVVFLAAGLVLLGVAPLEGGGSSKGGHGGISASLDGTRLLFFLMGRFYGFFLWSVITAVLFLGAWRLPSGVAEMLRESGTLWALEGAEIALLLCKVFALMLGVSLVASVMPRLRTDQVADFSWRVLSPLSFLSLVGATVWKAWGLV